MDLLSLYVLFLISDHVMFSREFFFCFLHKLGVHMRVHTTTLESFLNITWSEMENKSYKLTRRREALTWDALVDEWVHTVTLVIRGK